MNGRAFLQIACQLGVGNTEAHWRAAAGRAYYALFLECRDALENWGFLPQPRDPVHSFVRLRFLYSSDIDLKEVGRTLESLGELRNWADYRLAVLAPFGNDVAARRAIGDADAGLARLDTLAADQARQTSVVADIRARWP